MQVKKSQLQPEMEQQTGSKLGKEYMKAVYCSLAYLTYMQSTSYKMPGWMTHKLESRLSGEIRDMGSIPVSGRSSGGGNGKILQYSCLEKPMDRQDPGGLVFRVTQSQTQLKLLSMHTHSIYVK